MALVECQRQQQEGAPASREPHSSSYVSHAAHRYERTCIESHRSQPRRHSAMERRWKKNISRWKRETSITTMRNGRTREIEAGEGAASCDETRRDETSASEPHPAPYYARLTATGRDFTREPTEWRACAPPPLVGCGWTGLKGSYSTYYADTHSHC